MKKLILLMCGCVMALSGCGCANQDTNEDGIIGNDKVENNADMNNDNKDYDKNENFEDGDETIGSDASRMLRDAGNSVGRAIGDVGSGAENVVRDAGNAAGNMVN